MDKRMIDQLCRAGRQLWNGHSGSFPLNRDLIIFMPMYDQCRPVVKVDLQPQRSTLHLFASELLRCAFLLITGAAIVTNGFAQQAPEIEWEMCYGGAQNEEGHSIAQTNDGGYILAGARENGANGWDFHAVKIGPSGSVQWQ